MVIEVIIQKRLEKIVEYLTILRAQKPVPFEQFAKMPEHYALVERFLHLAVEACIDVGAHIVSQKKLGEVDVMRDIPRALRDADIIDAACAETFLSMIGFRNILVHGN